MRIERIDVAQNGFVLCDSNDELHIAKTLTELAQIAGELAPIHTPSATTYSEGKYMHDLAYVRNQARSGKKIEAIKHLRDCFTPRLGLREAKDLVEQLCF